MNEEIKIKLKDGEVDISQTKQGQKGLTGIKGVTGVNKLVEYIENDMKFLISQSRIVPVPESWFTRKTGITEKKTTYGFRERCAIPLFRSKTIDDSDSQKLGLGHTAGVSSDYTNLDRFNYLVRTNPGYVEGILKDILESHLNNQGISGTTGGINTYLGDIKSEVFISTEPNDWDKACSNQRLKKAQGAPAPAPAPEDDRKDIFKQNKDEDEDEDEDEEEKKSVEINQYNKLKRNVVKNLKNRGKTLPSNIKYFQQKRQEKKEEQKRQEKKEEQKQKVEGGSIYEKYSKKIKSAGSISEVKKIGGELKKIMLTGGGKHDRKFTKLIKQLGGKKDELIKKK